jgi:hypothetical protein
MAYTTIDKPSDYFNTKLYTGNGGTQSITGLDFQPDWCWLKARAGANVSNHRSVDSVRSATKELFQDATAAEETNTNGLTAFNSNGFSLGSSGGTNNSNTTYASWNWKAGTSFTNDASGTGIGTIDSTGSVNTDAGFSIISYTGTGSVATIAHGLGVTPKFYLIKNRTNARNWQSYHEPLGNQAYLRLNTTAAAATGAAIWNNTSPTSSVFSIGTSDFNAVNADGDNYIAYCFAEKQGYSKFGSYVGNGNADGAFVYTGFTPSFFLLKRTDGTNSWRMWDNKRDPFNVRDTSLNANETDAEYTDASVYMDFVSNGVKFRTTGDNTSGGNYIFMCFAENPFVTSTGVPACAR